MPDSSTIPENVIRLSAAAASSPSGSGPPEPSPRLPRRGPSGDQKDPEFFFRFPDESRAEAAARELRALSYTVEVTPTGPRRRSWDVDATGTPDDDTVELEGDMKRWAALAGGEYTGCDRPRTRVHAACVGVSIVGCELLARQLNIDAGDLGTHLLVLVPGTFIGVGIAKAVERVIEKLEQRLASDPDEIEHKLVEFQAQGRRDPSVFTARGLVRPTTPHDREPREHLR